MAWEAGYHSRAGRCRADSSHGHRNDSGGTEGTQDRKEQWWGSQRVVPGEEGPARARRGGRVPGGGASRESKRGRRRWGRGRPRTRTSTRSPASPGPESRRKETRVFGENPRGPGRVQEGLPEPEAAGSAPGPAPPPESPESWAVLHKCGPSPGTQGGLAAWPAGGGCLHSESAQMWGSRYTLVHEGRRPGLATANASAPSCQREAPGGGREGPLQTKAELHRPWPWPRASLN